MSTLLVPTSGPRLFFFYFLFSDVPLWRNKEDLIVGIVAFKLKVMGDDSPAAGRDEQARPDHRHPAGRRHPHGHQSAGLNDNFFGCCCCRVLL